MNAVVMVSNVEITILSLVLVDRTLRLSGALRLLDQQHSHLAAAPVLTVTCAGADVPLRSLGAHVLPQPPITWLAWTFDRPVDDLASLSGRIEQLELGYRSGSKTVLVTGPWLYEIELPRGLPAARPQPNPRRQAR